MDENVVAAPEGEVEETGSTTPEEVLSILGKGPAPAAEGADDESGDSDTDDSKNAEDGADSAAKPDEVKPDTPAAAEEAAKPEPSAEVAETPTFAIEVEDANGAKFTIEPGANLEEALKDFEPKNNGQIFQVIADYMQAKQDKTAYDTEQASKTTEAERASQVAAVSDGWDKEIAALQGAKRLPVGADGKSDERVSQVFTFMAQENEKRTQDGRPLLQSFEDALDKIELKETREAAADKAKADKEEARKNGGMVGGSSAPASSGAATYRPGARNANEALKSMGIL